MVPLTDAQEEKEGEKGRTVLTLNHQIRELLWIPAQNSPSELSSCNSSLLMVGAGVNIALILNLFYD